MNVSPLRGVYPILVTPFDEQERVDIDSLRNLVEFQLQAGVHGRGIALGSEVMKLTEAERALVTRTVADQVAGRVPVVVNTGGLSTVVTTYNSREAEENGADAVMIIPPTSEADADSLVRVYQTVAEAVSLSIFIQDLSNAHVPAAVARRIAEACPTVRYIKVESHPTPTMVGEVATAAAILVRPSLAVPVDDTSSRSCAGVPRGRCQAAVIPRPLSTCGRGQCRPEMRSGALNTFYHEIEPINRVAEQGWGAFHGVHKEILRQRGVIRTSVVRGPVRPLDSGLLCDLQRVIDQLYG